MSLHSPVIFIGDRPNPKKNLSMDVPFVGTKSYKILLEWIYRMDVDISKVVMMNAFDVLGTRLLTLRPQKAYPKVIVLGENADNAWRSACNTLARNIPSFKLPHPSGLNRELNDKKKLSEALAKCRAFIYKEPV